MATKRKLYTAKEWNNLQLGNAFALGGNTSIWERLTEKEYGSGYTPEQLKNYMYGTTAAEGNNSWLNISKVNNPFSRGNIGTTLSAAATAASPFTTSLISDGYSTGGVGEGISGIGSAVGSAVRGPLGAVITLGSGVIGGLTNRAFGTKNNEANINTINQNTALAQSAGNALSGASDTNSLLGAAKSMTGSTGFGTKDLVKGGWFSKSKARKKGQKYLDTESAALAFQNNALQAGAANVDRNIDNTALTSFAAFGGLLGYPNTFADGGIHIKHPGRLTALKERTGKTEAELYNDGNPAHKKMVVFARNSRKWNHGLGGVLNTSNPWNNGGIGSLNLMQNNDYIDAINNRTTAMYNNNNMGITGAMNAFGGELGTNGTDWTNGLLYIDEGQSHEENPYGGVQVGVDPEGTPNLVEEGETIYNDYVFSDRMKVPEFMYSQLGIKGAGKDGISFAKASKKLAKESENRPNDQISLDGLDAAMSKLAMIQETERLKKQVEEQNQFAMGGNLYPDGGALEWLNKYHPDIKNKGVIAEALEAYNKKYPRNSQVKWGVKYSNAFNAVTKGFGNLVSPETRKLYTGNDARGRQHFNDLLSLGLSKSQAFEIAFPEVDSSLGDLSNVNHDIKSFNEQNAARDALYRSLVDNSATATPVAPTAETRTGNVETTTDLERASRDSSIEQAAWDYVNRKAGQGQQSTGNGNSGKRASRQVSTRGYTETSDYLASQLAKAGFQTTRYGRFTDDSGNTFVARTPQEGEFLNNMTRNNLYGLRAATPTIAGAELSPLVVPEGGVTARPAEEETAVAAGNGNTDELPRYQTWMRYAPAVGAGIMTLTDLLGLTNRPDYSSAEKLEAAANAIAQSGNVSYDNPIGNYIKYNPMDITYGLNQLAAQSRATDRAIQNTAGTRGAATNAMLANGYNSQLAAGNLYRQALEYNDALQKQVEDFNRGTDQFNAQMGLEAALANARYRQAGLQARLSGLSQAAAIRDSIDQRVGAARSANITNLLNSLGNIGRENFAFNQVNSTAAANNGYGYGNNRGDVAHVNTGSKGGKLKRKNKK